MFLSGRVYEVQVMQFPCIIMFFHIVEQGKKITEEETNVFYPIA